MSRAVLKLSPLETLYAQRKKRPYYETERLRLRCEEVGIVPPLGQPIDNNVKCYRLPDLEFSAGGIVIPGSARSPLHKGILVAAGPRARDVLFSNGIQIGDIVTWARFAGAEHSDKTHAADLKTEFITLKDRDILDSDDLAAELASGNAQYVLDEKTGRHNLVRKMLGSSKKQKLLALAASTASPAEAETARRIAADLK